MVPIVLRKCQQIGLVDNPGYRKIHHTPVPLAGGPVIILAFTIITILGTLGLVLFDSIFESEIIAKLAYGIKARLFQIIMVLAGGIALGVMGILDDKSTYSARTKLLWQIIGAFLMAASGSRITIFIESIWIQYLLTIFWVLILVNAFNFIDNMNGASSGLGIITLTFCSTCGDFANQYLVPGIGVLFIGIILGVMFWNFPNAKIFLGDSGSHLIGYLVAFITIKATYYSAEINESQIAVISPLFFVAVPLIDISQVTVMRIIRGKPIWIGDTNHLTHIMARTRLGKVGAVVFLWGIAVLVGFIPFLFS